MRRSCDSVEKGPDRASPHSSGLATFSPRLGVTSRVRNVAGRRGLAADSSLRRLAAPACVAVATPGRGHFLANSKPSRVNSAQQA